MNPWLKRVIDPIVRLLPIQTVCRLLYRRRGEEIPILFCIDIEPDERRVDRGNPERWNAFEQLLPRVEELRERLANFTEAAVPITWLIRMDPQIADTWGSPTWPVDTYRDVLTELESRGDEFGLHTHLWRWDADVADWVTDHDPEWSGQCVSMALDAFERAFGRPCPVHRGGDHALTGEMLARLTAAGVKVDLTVEPGLPPIRGVIDWREIGHPPDYRVAPRRPYRSSPRLFPAPDPSADSTSPLLIPQASGPALRGLWGSQLPLGTHPSLFAARILAALRRDPPPVLVFTLRTDKGTLRLWDRLVSNLEQVARHPDARFATTSEVLARYDGSPDPSSVSRSPAAATS